MRKFLILAVAVLGVMALPGSAAAASIYDGSTCNGYTGAPPTAGVHLEAGTGGASAGACVNTGTGSFQGGSVEAGVGEDPATGAADPGPGPDAYAVVDGDNDNWIHPQSDGYAGVSNWETGGTRATTCGNGAANSSNSGGCINNIPIPPGAAGSVPTPVCGNTSGNSWNGQGTTEGSGNRDGCEVP